MGGFVGSTTTSLQIESISPEKAREYLGCNYKHNRPLRKMHVDYLEREMKDGRFLPTAEIHLMYCNGEPVLVNGQHTCAAIIKYGKPVRVTVRKSNTSEHGQIAMFYAFGHDTGLRRTFTDGLGAYNLDEQTGLMREEVEWLATAIRHIRLGFRADFSGVKFKLLKPSVAEVVERVVEWAPYARNFWTTVNGSDKKLRSLTNKRGSLSVVVVTVRYQPERALDFWRQVFAPDNLPWDHPAVVTRRTIEASRGAPGTSGVTPQRLSRQVARCWRAYWNGENMKQLPKVDDESSPIYIVGTPFTGRHPEPPWFPED